MSVIALVILVVFAVSAIVSLREGYRRGKKEDSLYEEWRSTMPEDPSRYDREEE